VFGILERKDKVKFKEFKDSERCYMGNIIYTDKFKTYDGLVIYVLRQRVFCVVFEGASIQV
jgi:hypothetical protein